MENKDFPHSVLYIIIFIRFKYEAKENIKKIELCLM